MKDSKKIYVLVFPILIKKISKTYDPLMILSPSLLLPKRKLFVSPIPAEMVRSSKCHDWKNFKNAVMIVRHSWQNLIPMLRNFLFSSFTMLPIFALRLYESKTTNIHHIIGGLLFIHKVYVGLLVGIILWTLENLIWGNTQKG